MAKGLKQYAQTWNYFTYAVIEVVNEYDQNVIEDAGECEQRAREILKEYREKYPERCFVLQQQHFVSRIIG